MRIDSSGNVGIGTSSPSRKLDVQGAPSGVGGNGTGVLANFVNNSTAYNASPTSAISLWNRYNTAGGTFPSAVLQAGKENTTDGNFAGYMSLQTTSSAGDSTERMRIDSSGNLLVGTTSASGRLTVNGVGATSATNCTVINNSTGANLFIIRNDGAFFTGAQAGSPFNLTIASAANAVLNTDGFLYRSTSSLKYKTDVNDATYGLAELLTLRPVTYKGKSDADGDKVYGGLIAEEVHETGLTEFVQYAADGTPDALHYGNMVSLCIKAIQEQQALIQDLTTRLTTLEGN
jgi:hypothetical protein